MKRKTKNRFNRNTIAYLLQERANQDPRAIPYSFPEFQQQYSWQSLWHEVRQLAKSFLQLGIKKGDSIALLLEGRMELIVSMYAAACIGAVVVPLNTYSKKQELRTFLQDARPCVMIIGEGAHGLCYPAMLAEIVAEYEPCHADSLWIPAHIYVVQQGGKHTKHLFPMYEDLQTLAASKTDEDLDTACLSVLAEDPLVHLYTSGTTGSPKAVLRTTASFLRKERARQGIATAWLSRLTSRLLRRFSIMSMLPLYHMGGIGALLAPLTTVQIKVVLLSHYNPLLALSTLDQERSQFVLATPFMMQRMISIQESKQYDLSNLLGVIFSSAAVTGSVLQKVINHLDLMCFVVSYGSSEAGAVSTGVCFMNSTNHILLSILFTLLRKLKIIGASMNYSQFAYNPYSLTGRVEKGVDVAIVHPDSGNLVSAEQHGEIMIRSHRVMRYVNEEASGYNYTQDGWYRSGDIGFLDEHGNLTITGRLRRLISRGGEKIHPEEIEGILLQHQDVQEAVVLGVPDDMYGEQICACIVARCGSLLTPEQLRQDLSPLLSSFKIPRYFMMMPSLPMSPTGKISVETVRPLIIDEMKEMLLHA